jgi:hypothetical protein
VQGPHGTVTLAAVCKRGHVIDLAAGPLPDPDEDPRFCEECGAPVLRVCRSCEAPLLGVPPFPDASGNLDAGSWRRPDFCRECGHPFPWIDRAGRIRHLENLLDREELDEATELAVREQLEALADPDADDRTTVKRMARLRELAPGFWERSGVREVLVTLATTEAKRQLGLPL